MNKEVVIVGEHEQGAVKELWYEGTVIEVERDAGTLTARCHLLSDPDPDSEFFVGEFLLEAFPDEHLAEPGAVFHMVCTVSFPKPNDEAFKIVSVAMSFRNANWTPAQLLVVDSLVVGTFTPFSSTKENSV